MAGEEGRESGGGGARGKLGSGPLRPHRPEAQDIALSRR